MKIKFILEKLKIIKEKNNPISLKICEPNLGKRGLYQLVGTTRSVKSLKNERNILNFLQYADGSNSIKKIARLIKVNLINTKRIYFLLKKKKLVG